MLDGIKSVRFGIFSNGAYMGGYIYMCVCVLVHVCVCVCVCMCLCVSVCVCVHAVDHFAVSRFIFN